MWNKKANYQKHKLRPSFANTRTTPPSYRKSKTQNILTFSLNQSHIERTFKKWESAKKGIPVHIEPKKIYILKPSKKRTPRGVFLAHEKPLFLLCCAWTAVVVNMWPAKSLMGTRVSEFLYGSYICECFDCFRGHTHYTVLLLYSSSYIRRA